ncbi:unknown protein [Microcystis aeruginosa NIES-843]|uniref:Uncharacterized protein n=1 Tax=Microcystis aeruginosa (strain NIES-843 / IAM M-2473) TaxID=449447 RepID=B0JNV2_MICAN|nr:unknown protein [Microcystis aeruginosa NIES-843]
MVKIISHCTRKCHRFGSPPRLSLGASLWFLSSSLFRIFADLYSARGNFFSKMVKCLRGGGINHR